MRTHKPELWIIDILAERVYADRDKVEVLLAVVVALNLGGELRKRLNPAPAGQPPEEIVEIDEDGVVHSLGRSPAPADEMEREHEENRRIVAEEGSL